MRGKPTALALLPAVLVLAGALQAQDKTAAPSAAGPEVCKGCHDIAEGFDRSGHGALVRAKGRNAETSCQSCHGPTAKHAESAEAKDILNPAKLSAARTGAICLSCHQGKTTHVGRVRDGHAHNEVSCTQCHGVHVSRKATTKLELSRSCGGCHTEVWVRFQRPNAHRVPLGIMSCIDCHNPHGGPPPDSSRLASTNEPGCIRCHGDKRGPFAFEHAPVRFEGCTSCHEPHGSVNPRMLVRHEARILCQECHAGTVNPSGFGASLPPAFHDLRSPRYRNCTTCHVKVHGSHVDRNLLR